MSTGKLGKLEQKAIAYTSACHGLVHVLELTYGAVLIGIAQEFGASLLVLGVLANIFGFAFGVTALPSGYLADRMSERHLLMVCCLGMAAASIAIGLSPNIYMLGAALLVLGLALGIYHPTGAAFITRITTHRGLGFGYLGIGGSIGVAAGPILAGAIASFWGWRASYFVFAVPALFLALMFYLFARTEIPVIKQSTAESGTKNVSLRPFLLPLALIFCIQVLNGFIYRGIVTFLPLYFGERIQFTFLNMDSLLIAGAFTTIALIFGVGGQFLGGNLAERRHRESLALIITLIVTPLLVAIASSSGLPLLGVAIVFALFYFMGQPIFNCLVADYCPPSWRGRMFGISFFCVFGVGSFSAPLLGYIADRFGTSWVFMVSAGFSLLAVICAVFLLVRAMRVSRYSQVMSDKQDLGI
ncbi:MAG TPA: MFS transporter [Dehalococcoidales bacterium]|nr:MFS transporter [Dehalococcoidales bacterium]